MQKTWLDNYPEGVPHDINPDQFRNVLEVVNTSCKKFGEKTAYECFGSQMSFAEFDKLSDDFASFLQHELGLAKGDRIAIQMPNLLQYPIAMFGAMKAGLIIVNTNPLYTEREMKHQFNDSGAKAIVILANFAHMLEKVIGETTIDHVVVTELGDLLGFPKSWVMNAAVKHIKKMVPPFQLEKFYSFRDALEHGAKKELNPVDLEPGDTAFLQYTGGTTGVSKGAVLTHRNIVANMLQIQAWISPRLNEGEETIVTALPLYHIFSLTVNCLAFMSFGGKNLLVTNPKDINGFVKLLKKTRFTVFAGVNTLFNALMNHPDFDTIDFSEVKISIAGAMALQRSVSDRWKETTQSFLAEGYGLTEASPAVCVNPIDGTDRVGTIGMPIPSTEIKLIDESGSEVAEGQEGELCIRGPQVMQGYYKRPDESTNVLIGEGWLRTGDIAICDKDGYFKIVDRKKDMILVSGFNVYPNEVEDVVSSHDQVSEVAAVGVPDEKSGEVVKLFVVRKSSSLSEDEVRSYCADKLVAYKRPKYVEFRDDLPKTNVGKILRRALRDQ